MDVPLLLCNSPTRLLPMPGSLKVVDLINAVTVEYSLNKYGIASDYI